MDTPAPTSAETQEKIDFFLISAHELRTSLTAMKWLFNMLLDGDFGKLSETQSAMLKQGETANDRMIALVNDTMTVIRADDASIPYITLPVSFSALTQESINDFTSEAAHKDMHIRYTPPTTPVMVIGDGEKLRIVLHNLLENAIKYGDRATDINLTLAASGGNAVLRVADRGIGIPPDEQHRVFEKFFRASNAKAGSVGVGLGLYATKHIVERHGGTLAFESTESGETVFVLTLPLG